MTSVGDFPAEADIKFELDGEVPIDTAGKGILLGPGYIFDKSKDNSGHRIFKLVKDDDLTRNDIAIIKLEQPVDVTKFEPYAINRGEIAEEFDPALRTPLNIPANAVKVGYGAPGNGPDGSLFNDSDGLKREMFNIIDGLGNGKDIFHKKTVDLRNPKNDNPEIRNNPPPKNTLLYDFDEPTPAGV